MPIIAIANQKGGVGKTTTTLNLGAALQEAGKRVLLVDLDPQGSLSIAAGVTDIDAASPSIGELLTLAARGRATSSPGIGDAIVMSPAGLEIVVANSALSTAELDLVATLNRESILNGLLRPLEAMYDYILIDCLPSLGLLTINALRAASGIIIPVQADFLAIQGLAQILETVAAVRGQLNPNLEILGVLLTLVDHRTAHAREVVRIVRSSLAGQVRVFDAEIRLHVALKETAKAGRSILEYDTGSPSAAAYRRLANEVLAVYAGTAPTVGDEPSVDARVKLPVKPPALVVKPKVVVLEPAVVVVEPDVVVGEPDVVVGEPDVVVGEPDVVVRPPEVVVRPPDVVVLKPEDAPGAAPAVSPPAPQAVPSFESYASEGLRRWLGVS